MEQKNFDTNGAVEYLKLLGLSFRPGTLEVWRSQGKGPRFKKVARKVFYDKAALDQFAEGQSFETVDSYSPSKRRAGENG